MKAIVQDGPHHLAQLSETQSHKAALRQQKGHKTHWLISASISVLNIS